MRIVMIGAGYVGLVTGTCLADFGHEVVCVDTQADKVAALRLGHVPIYEPGLERTGSSQPERRAPVLRDEPQGGRARSESHFHRRRHAVAGGGRLGRSQLRACRRARDRRGDRGLHRRRREVDGSGRLLRRGRADHRRAGAAREIRSRIQSGIPARRRGDRGFQAARPDRRRRRRRASGRGDARDVPPHGWSRRSACLHLATQLRDDQVRRQCVSGDESDVHQRGRGPVRARGRRRRRRLARHRARPTDRLADSSIPVRVSAGPAFPRTRWR